MTEKSVTNKSLEELMAKIVNREEKKAEILQAALRVIAEKGIAGTKIQAIADEAGMGKGTVYLYFKNKEEILQSILEQHVNSGSLMSEELMSESDLPLEKIRALLQGMTESMGNHESSPGLYLEILAALLRSHKVKVFESGLTGFRDHLADLFGELQGCGKAEPLHRALSSSMIALLHGMSLLYSVNPKGFPMKETMDLTTEFIVEALKKDSD